MLKRTAPWIGLITLALAWVGMAAGLQRQETASKPSPQQESPASQRPSQDALRTAATEREPAQPGQTAVGGALRQAVEGHWQALEAGRKYSALEWVEEASRNDFILRRELPIRSYRIEDIRLQGRDQARVSVQVEALLAGAAQPFASLASQQWSRDGQGNWRLVYRPSTRQAYEAIFSPPAAPPEPRGQLEVLPRQGLRIHAVDPRRQGVLVIANGGSEPARLTDVVLDEKLLQVVEAPDSIDPGQRAALRLRLLAAPEDPVANSNVLVVLQQGDEKKAFSVSVLCNYRSPAALKWFSSSDGPRQDR